jgi:hypothetical protein
MLRSLGLAHGSVQSLGGGLISLVVGRELVTEALGLRASSSLGGSSPGDGSFDHVRGGLVHHLPVDGMVYLSSRMLRCSSLGGLGSMGCSCSCCSRGVLRLGRPFDVVRESVTQGEGGIKHALGLADLLYIYLQHKQLLVPCVCKCTSVFLYVMKTINDSNHRTRVDFVVYTKIHRKNAC